MFVFEEGHGATDSSKNHFMGRVKQMDVMIFLIDNKDDIKEGTKKEIAEAKKNNIKSLFYFCNENKKEITDTQRELMKSDYCTYKEVKTFESMY